ncbi:hsp90-like protein [Stagonosporopsis vannaccii]|nr:hsp90-like protein [Stagonosporopsis vannaccii]
MDPPGLESFLSQLGIKRHQYGQGKLGWTIDVVVDEAESHTKAIFDEQLGRWKLQSIAENKLSSKSATAAKATIHHEPTHLPVETAWTDAFPASAHTEVLLNIDWESTSLGPLHTWNRPMQLYTQMLLADPRPATIYWGSQRIAIYNEAAVPLMGTFHPTLLGRSVEEYLPLVWDYFGHLFYALENGQHGFAKQGIELPSTRHGYLEESWWDGGLIALKDDRGGYAGTYFSWTEVTRTTLRDRRTRIINQLGHSSLSTDRSFWQHVHDVLREYPRDIPMAIMYSMDDNDPLNNRLHREHTIGLGAAYAAAPSELDLTSTAEDAAITSLLQRARQSSEDSLVIDMSKEDIDARILECVEWLGFGEPSRHLAIIPLRNKLSIIGFVVLALNPRRDFDEDHEQFVIELARQLNETAIRVTFRQDVQVREKILTTELSESEKRASRMAQIVPVGIYELAADGALHWANNQFFEIMGVPQGQRQKDSFAWTDYIHPEDHDRANEKMGRCLLHGDDITDTLRLKRGWRPPGVDPSSQNAIEPFWVMYSASLNLNTNGTTSSLTGSITNISHLKWAEQLQLRNAEAAQRERRIQEEFIDITSHEMRNPLSAITQSADGILLSLQDAEDVDSVETLHKIVKLNAEAAESILFCAAHQRRIIDDILTLGKLDSKLLAISPAAFRLEDLLDQAMQMFRAEFEANNIKIRTGVDVIPADAKQTPAAVSTFIGDSSRLLQVLVNLMTNAIKFTKTQPVRNITVRCGSSYASPPSQLFGQEFQWHYTGLLRPDLTQDSEYGKGDEAHVYFAVTDTGEGIPAGALERIFTKFEQADRRTHTKYGGSGLGLYISRELTELQGGCIGIESAVGVGSTFAFYTKVRQSETQTTYTGLEANHSNPSPVITGLSEPLSPRNEQRSGSSTPKGTYNILVVEDNVLNQTVLAKQLRRAGCNVQISSHGGEAVDIILRKHGQPAQYDTAPPDDALPYLDCILMDWEMPICDGIQATKQIRIIEQQQSAFRSLIIGITANARAEQIKKAREAGMDTVVPKPFRVAELLAKISAFVAPS